MLASFMLILAGCQTSIEPSNNEVNISTTEEVLGFAALTAVEELKQDLSINRIENTNISQEQINSKLYIANTFLSDSARFDVNIQNQSDLGYNKTMIISYVDMDKNVNTHEFHYNETIMEVEDDEIKSSITGLIIVNGVEYILTGTKEQEENEYEYDLVASLDDENYITIKYEVENEGNEIEKEFEYERFVENQLEYRMEIEFEVEENDEKEINVKLLDGNFESEYSFKSEIEDGKKEIKVEYKISQDGVVINEREFSSYNEINE